MKAAAMKVVKKAAMKTMKTAVVMKAATKAMKAVMKKKKVATGTLAKSLVFSGRREKTSTGLKKSHLKKNKQGKIVSVAKSAQGKKAYARIRGWTMACEKARKALNVKGFVPIKKGTPFYKKAKEFYDASK